MAESEEEPKNLLMKVKEESKKAGLKLNIQKAKIMASSPISSWQINAETMETVRDFILLGSKITADGGCSHEIKRCLLQTFSDVNHSRILYDPPPTVMEIKAKINKWDLIKLKNFCTMKEMQGEKTAFRMGENNSK